ncbi:hypothetical protein B566_EDAN016373 [Ephemera danica]|nr:hypothetical protein B566_EDAN016373 [Ephemera danica]
MKNNEKPTKNRKTIEKKAKKEDPDENTPKEPMKNNEKPTKNRKTIEKKAKKEDPDENTPKEPKYGPMPKLPNHRLWTRGVMVLSVMVVLYFTSHKGREVILAKQSEPTHHRGQHVHCSDDYKAELQKFPGCVPEQCGRIISDGLVSAREARDLLDLAKIGMSLGGSKGGATILDLHSGALSLGTNFVNVYSLPKASETFSAKEFALYKAVRTKIHHAVAHHFGVDATALHLTHPTFFSRLTAEEPQTDNDQYWHPHVDKETYEAFHYTSLLYLNDFSIDFQGGRFIFLDQDSTNRTVEPRKGRVSMFTSGSENRHMVERVTSGERFALTVSFTCNTAAAISDPAPKVQSS